MAPQVGMHTQDFLYYVASTYSSKCLIQHVIRPARRPRDLLIRELS
jgi:hypothetical protein